MISKPADGYWIAEFVKLSIKPEVRPLILKENAGKLLGL
jgi:predicted TIM-barrel fold metal-dependent hydrolase